MSGLADGIAAPGLPACELLLEQHIRHVGVVPGIVVSPPGLVGWSQVLC